jgi:hypothetical protein
MAEGRWAVFWLTRREIVVAFERVKWSSFVRVDFEEKTERPIIVSPHSTSEYSFTELMPHF